MDTQTNGGANGAPDVEPELTPADVKLITQSFAGKCCPLGLIGLSMPQATSPLSGPLGQPVKGAGGGELVGCQGPACMWFRLIKTPDKKVVGGDCVVPMTLGAVASLPSNLGGVLAQLGKFRFTPNGG